MKTQQISRNLEGFLADWASDLGDWAKDVLPDSMAPSVDAAETALTKAIDKVDVGSIAWSVAGASGVPLPLQSEVQSLSAKGKTLNQLYYRAQAYKDSQLPPIRTLDMPQAADKANAMYTTLSQAQSECVAAQKLLADALALGQSTQAQIKSGNLNAVTGTENFFSKKQGADAAYDSALVRINGACAQFETLQRDAIAWGKLKVSDVTDAMRKTAEETAARVRATTESLGKFAPFALPLAIALLAGYAIMSIGPRRR